MTVKELSGSQLIDLGTCFMLHTQAGDCVILLKKVINTGKLGKH